MRNLTDGVMVGFYSQATIQHFHLLLVYRIFVLQSTKGNAVFDYKTGDEIIKYKGETTERFLKRIYGKDLVCLNKVYHFPSSFEELCIMNDLNGR